jgi:hypothetical protein
VTNEERARQIHAKHHPDSCGYQYMQKSCLFCDELAAAFAEARLEEAEWLRVEDFHEHNTFEPDNCNCRFCKRIAELKQQIGERSC